MVVQMAMAMLSTSLWQGAHPGIVQVTSLDSYAWPRLPIYNAIALHNSHGTNLLARQRRTI